MNDKSCSSHWKITPRNTEGTRMKFTNKQQQAIRCVIDGQYALIESITGATPRCRRFNEQVEKALEGILSRKQIEYVLDNECKHLRFNGWA